MPSNKLNILYVTSHFPLPLIGGDRIKQYNILKHLSKDHNVHLVSMDRGFPITAELIMQIEELGIKVYPIHLNRFKAFTAGMIFSPLGGPLEVEYFRNKEFENTISSIVKAEKIDIGISFFLRTSAYLNKYDFKKILIADDCRSYYQKNTARYSGNIKQFIIRNYESKKLMEYERKITSKYDVTTLVTGDDLKHIRSLNSNCCLKILSHGVDIHKFVGSDNNQRKDLLFLGKLDVWVNLLMLKKILNDIFPKILVDYPETKLRIVGANPSKSLISKMNKNVILHKDVNDIVPFLQSAAAFIHPHRGGSGLQNKLLEAMSCGCPVITTSSGARGINIVNGYNGYIADNDEDFVSYAGLMLNNIHIREQISQQASKTIREQYLWSNVGNQLDDILNELSA